MQTFPSITVTGDARARGAAHGEAFRGLIRAALDLYLQGLFAQPSRNHIDLSAGAAEAEAAIVRFAPDIAAEISGIARGANLPPWQVFLLNARTEILNSKEPECTAFYLKDSAVLAQNWDWIKELEDLCVVIEHEPDDGLRYIAFGEAGMVGKIGLNERGVGVGLNILFAPHPISGLPVHPLTQAVLRATDLAQACEVVRNSGVGKASHILIGDGAGNCRGFEFMGDARHEVEARNGYLLHTNHCIAPAAKDVLEDLGTTKARYACAKSKLDNAAVLNCELARDLLDEREIGDGVLNRPYLEAQALKPYLVGTCATVVMELNEARLSIRKGPLGESEGEGRAFSHFSL
ncbi:MAG: C45 family peptidase [Pseudomonadota bacterium]